VEASDEGGRQRALITLGGAADDDLSQRLRAALAAIALTVEIRFD
jgi:fatty-acyl-CoA synthase